MFRGSTVPFPLKVPKVMGLRPLCVNRTFTGFTIANSLLGLAVELCEEEGELCEEEDIAESWEGEDLGLDEPSKGMPSTRTNPHAPKATMASVSAGITTVFCVVITLILCFSCWTRVVCIRCRKKTHGLQNTDRHGRCFCLWSAGGQLRTALCNSIEKKSATICNPLRLAGEMKQRTALPLLLALLWLPTACAQDTPSSLSKEEVKSMGKSDHSADYCEWFHWYGDGECDTFCLLPDPDCELPYTGCGQEMAPQCPSGQLCAEVDCQSQQANTCSMQCVDDPCADVICDSPNEPLCVGETTLRSFEQGQCTEGSCVYSQSDTVCEFRCEQGACVTGCGDGIVQQSETCDDGNRVDGDGCTADCDVEQDWQCSQEPSVCQDEYWTPFHSNSCTGSSITQATASQYFATGTSSSGNILQQSAYYLYSRDCEGSGCGDWQAAKSMAQTVGLPNGVPVVGLKRNSSGSITGRWHGYVKDEWRRVSAWRSLPLSSSYFGRYERYVGDYQHTDLLRNARFSLQNTILTHSCFRSEANYQVSTSANAYTQYKWVAFGLVE